MTATASCCGFSGTLAAIELHDCAVQESGGRCEDFPCCGHTDGDGCQTLPSHTSAFYYDNPAFLYEPGSPEWYDAQEYDGDYDVDDDEEDDDAKDANEDWDLVDA